MPIILGGLGVGGGGGGKATSEVKHSQCCSDRQPCQMSSCCRNNTQVRKEY